MGMFDYYQPSEKIICPVCEIELKEWQGKDADCVLVIWKQGQSYPDNSLLLDEETAMPEDTRRNWRLPKTFTFYSYDCEKHCVWVEGRTDNDIWVENRIILVEDLEKKLTETKRLHSRFK